jgi:hypothetical protein
LPVPAGADAEVDVAVLDAAHVALLIAAPGLDRAAARADHLERSTLPPCRFAVPGALPSRGGLLQLQVQDSGAQGDALADLGVQVFQQRGAGRRSRSDRR